MILDITCKKNQITHLKGEAYSYKNSFVYITSAIVYMVQGCTSHDIPQKMWHGTLQ